MTNLYPIVLDLETKRTFREQSDPAKLGITVVGIYDFEKEKEVAFFENDISSLLRIVEKASMIIGYNIIGFDIPVLQSYYHGVLSEIPMLDICEEIRLKIGKRVGLADVAKATLNKGKSGHGLKAIELYKEGKLDELRDYCLDDVRITKEIFDYGVKWKEIFIPDGATKRRIQVNWSLKMESKKTDSINLGLPF